MVVAFTTALSIQGAAGAVPATTHPALRLIDGQPLTLRGTGFRDGEHVRVVVTADTRATKFATASTRGAFVVNFPGENVNACAGFSATAIGSDGSRAHFKRSPGQCPAP